MRQDNFTILKAVAIICVVLSHAGLSGWFYDCVFLFHVPVFFLCAGYFFNTRYLTDERTFLVHRIRGLYLPFVRWSVLFLVLHNLMFRFGILSEQYGNAQGGVLHPYTWHQFSVRLWQTVWGMSGYDEFLCGSFWFFRALFLGSIGFLVLFKVLQRSDLLRADRRHCAWALVIVSLLLTAWKVGCNIPLQGLSGGGYRELMAMSLMAVGYLVRQYNVVERLNWKIAAASLLVLALCATYCPTSMTHHPTFQQFASLPLPATAAFLALLYGSTWLAGSRLTWLSRPLIYIGERTLYVFAFHLVAFKAVSAVKVSWYHLPWQAVGGHPTVLSPQSNALWVVLYVVAGVGIPLLWLWAYRKLAARIHVNVNGGQIVRALIIAAQYAGRGVVVGGRIAGRLVVAVFQSIKRGIKEIIDASSTKEE